MTSQFTYDKDSDFNKSSRSQAILTKAIEKAIDGGWDNGYQVLEIMAAHPPTKSQFGVLTLSVVFNHDFAKALWGDRQLVAYQFHNTLERDEQHLTESGIYPLWKWHLVRMVITENPIKYLGEHLD